MRWKLLPVCLSAGLTGFMAGPNYKRPNVSTPPQFRGGESPPAHASLAEHLVAAVRPIKCSVRSNRTLVTKSRAEGWRAGPQGRTQMTAMNTSGSGG
jgi:hypothetical protein